ncbi:unnamed protein product [Rotaria sp. Silwood2]|nr:unnamed protein product [Rotaria sp. Silwood2]
MVSQYPVFPVEFISFFLPFVVIIWHQTKLVIFRKVSAQEASVDIVSSLMNKKNIPLTDISFVPRTRLKHDMILNQVVLNNGRQIIQGIKGHNDLTLFHVYIILREIISYIYANPIRKSWLPYSDGLYKQFYSLMIELLPDYATPKVHFITESPRSIEMDGLPILNSCIRFES